MNYMFNSCSKLTEIDTSKFITPKATSMLGMFQSASSLTSLDLSGFDLTNVSTTSNMFLGASGLKNIYVNKEKWDLSNVTYTSDMFKNCGTNVYIDKGTKEVFGYTIEKGMAWNGTAGTRSSNSTRASNTEKILIDPSRTYRLSIVNAGFACYTTNNSSYHTVLITSSTNITGLDNIEINIKKNDDSTITDADLETLTSNFKIEIVE